jgi:hypothetical protein
VAGVLSEPGSTGFDSSCWAFDPLVKLCADFYGLEEVDNARQLLGSLVPQKRLGRPKGSEMDVVAKSVSAMLKIILDTSCKVPIFCSVNINRLPPVDIDHVDVSAILLELSALRREVRVVEQLRQEVTLLKKCVEDLRSTERNDDRSVRDTEIKVAKVSSETLVKDTAPARASYAELAGRLLRSDFDKSPQI